MKFRGISDIAIDDLKILGSALYQNKDVVFYHAVLNVGESTNLMESILNIPQENLIIEKIEIMMILSLL